MVTSVPPETDPLLGDQLVTVGSSGSWYVKADERVTVPPSGLVTLTDTVPGMPGGVRTVTEVAVNCSTVPAVAPKRTTAPGWKAVTAIATWCRLSSDPPPESDW